MGAQSWRVTHTSVSFTSGAPSGSQGEDQRKILLLTEDGESLETQGTFHPDKTEGSALVDAEFPMTTYHLLMCPA